MSDDRKRGLPVAVKMRHDNHFVDELARRHEEPLGRMLSVSSIEPDPAQPRSSMGDLEDLTTSIREKGMLEPILVRPNPAAGSDGARSLAPYRIISGERRYHAALAAGLHDVPVIEMDVGESEALELALIENLQRKDLTPFEESEGYRALGERFGYTHEQISNAVAKSRTVVTESLALLQMPARARDAAQALGIASKSLLLEVLRASGGDEDEMIRLLESARDRGLSRDDLRQAAARTKARRRKAGTRRMPYTFRFKAPDRSYSLSLSFRRSEVDRQDLISALEQILTELREAEGRPN